MKDTLGDRIKSHYEGRTQFHLPRRTYTVIRIDGKAFHSYTKGLTRPFDDQLMNDMDETAMYLCKNIQGAKLAYVQSDEITVVATDFDGLETDAWFDGNVQKITSISAALATAKFNELRPGKIAVFDSRCFTVPTKTEVINSLIWRQQDCTRNSISSVAQSLYSHKELHGKNTSHMQDMIWQKGINWNDYSPKYKRGRVIKKESYELNGGTRSRWISTEPPIFTQDRDFLNNLIPDNL